MNKVHGVFSPTVGDSLKLSSYSGLHTTAGFLRGFPSDGHRGCAAGSSACTSTFEFDT